MREIEISTEVFALIWSHRTEGEETEDEILRRILRKPQNLPPVISREKAEVVQRTTDRSKRSDVLWRDDIVTALKKLGGEADLHEIYRVVRQLRLEGQRSLPASTDAVIRRELENNSSDSESFTKQRDLFRSVNGIGGGRWALR